MKRFFYNNFRRYQPLKNRVLKRLSPAGLFLLYFLMVSGVIGLDTKQTLAYQLFSLLLAALVFALACSLWPPGRFSVRRELPPFATVFEPLHYRLMIENKTGRKQTGLSLSEDLAPVLPTYEEFAGIADPTARQSNAFDRWTGYYHWLRLFKHKQPAQVTEQALPDLPPHGDTEIRAMLIPQKRGYLRLTGLRISRPDPLGLIKKPMIVPCAQSLLVLPKRYRVPPNRLPGTRRHQPGGIALASSIGDSEEFMSLRDYRPGDPLRHIHWKSWAKRNKPIVKEHQDEFFVRHALILDTFQKEPFSETFEEAVSVAASFACTLQTQESLLDLLFIGTEAFCFTVGRSLAHTAKILEILACVKPCTDKPFSTLPPLVVQRASLLSGCICVFLAWDRARQDLVGLLKALQVPVRVLVITDRKPAVTPDPGPLRGRPEDLVFLEAGKIAEGLPAC